MEHIDSIDSMPRPIPTSSRQAPDKLPTSSRQAPDTLPHAGDWLHAAPILALGLHLQPLEFVLAASYRLGLPLYRVEGASPTCPACHQPADIYGIHAMNCGTGGERIHRHTLLVDVVHQVAAAAQLAPRKEVRFLIPGRDWTAPVKKNTSARFPW